MAMSFWLWPWEKRTKHPTFRPTIPPALQQQEEFSLFPTFEPTNNPIPTSHPTSLPTSYPTSHPTAYPTPFPTSYPTSFPTAAPTKQDTILIQAQSKEISLVIILGSFMILFVLAYLYCKFAASVNIGLPLYKLLTSPFSTPGNSVIAESDSFQRLYQNPDYQDYIDVGRSREASTNTPTPSSVTPPPRPASAQMQQSAYDIVNEQSALLGGSDYTLATLESQLYPAANETISASVSKKAGSGRSPINTSIISETTFNDSSTNLTSTINQESKNSSQRNDLPQMSWIDYESMQSRYVTLSDLHPSQQGSRKLSRDNETTTTTMPTETSYLVPEKDLGKDN